MEGGVSMEKVISIKELRPKLPSIVNDIDTKMTRYIISRRGKPLVVMLSIDDFNSLQETMEVLSDKDLMRSIKKGMDEIRSGEVVSWESVKSKLS